MPEAQRPVFSLRRRPPLTIKKFCTTKAKERDGCLGASGSRFDENVEGALAFEVLGHARHEGPQLRVLQHPFIYFFPLSDCQTYITSTSQSYYKTV